MIDWNSHIQTDSDTQLSLEEWLRQVYLQLTDEEVSAKLCAQGMQCTPGAIRSKRGRLGLKKPFGPTAAESDEWDITVVEAAVPTHVQGLPSEALLQAIRDKPRSLPELSRQFDRSEATIRRALDELKAQHFNIVERASETVLDTQSAAVVDTARMIPCLADQQGMVVRLGQISDLHAGSTAQQITALNRFILDLVERGIQVFFVSGDLVAGHEVYRGQVHDLFAIGADSQLVVLDMSLPRIDGVHYYMIGGNHDYAYVKAGGFNVVSAFAARRDDVTYLGFDMADLPITDRADARLWHPHGGMPYAVSYRLQKGVEQMAFDELNTAITTGENPKLSLVQSGHLHTSITMWLGPILGLQSGCFEGQTNYLKRRSIFPQIGGYLMEIWLTDSGLIKRCREEFIRFTEIQDDFQNYPQIVEAAHGRDRPAEVEALFIWEPSEV